MGNITANNCVGAKRIWQERLFRGNAASSDWAVFAWRIKIGHCLYMLLFGG